MNDEEATDWLKEAIWESDTTVLIRDIKTFEEAGLITSNKGLVVILEDGQEIQLTVVV